VDFVDSVANSVFCKGLSREKGSGGKRGQSPFYHLLQRIIDGKVEKGSEPFFKTTLVIPAKAGIQSSLALRVDTLDPGMRRDDDKEQVSHLRLVYRSSAIFILLSTESTEEHGTISLIWLFSSVDFVDSVANSVFCKGLS